MRTIERPYTRISKSVPRKSYVVGVPFPKTHQFEMGNRLGNFDIVLYAVAKNSVQVRDPALEAARIVASKFLETKLGELEKRVRSVKQPSDSRYHLLTQEIKRTAEGRDLLVREISFLESALKK